MKNIFRGLGAAIFALVLTGCSTVAPQYTASLDNVSTLKKSSATKAAVAAFGSADAKVNEVTIRGGAMQSPYDGSYAKYVTEALKQELTLAGRYDQTAGITIDGTLLKNEMDASGFVTGYANIEVRFTVKQGSTVRFDKVKSVAHQWESSFAGPVAIPRALAEYPVAVRKLLTLLYADPDFDAALK